MEVKVSDNNIEKALRDMKRLLQKGGLFRELKYKRYYEKPSEKKKRKRAEAKKNKMKALRARRARQRY